MHAVTVAPTPFLSPGGRLEIVALPAATDNLVWVGRCVRTGSVFVVDGPDATAVDAWQGDRPVDTLLTTHVHGDHVGLHRAWERAGRLPPTVVGARATAAAIPGLTDPVDDGDPVRVGEVEGRVIRTDGHLTGHVCYLLDGALFCGDTLFAGGCGYLFDGPARVMFDSLMRLASLPPETLVCCAHEYTLDNLTFAAFLEPENGALADRLERVRALRARGACTLPSTLAEERATNPFLRPGSPSLVARLRALMPEAALATHAEVFAATRLAKDRKLHRS